MIARYLVLVVASLVILLPKNMNAQATSSWLKAEQPSVRAHQLAVPFDRVPASSNRNCLAQAKFIKVPSRPLQFQNEISYLSCATTTMFGKQDTNGNIALTDSSIAGPLKDANGTTLTLLPMPNSRHVLSIGSNPYIVRNVAENIKTSVLADGSLYHQLTATTPIVPLRDTSGVALTFADSRLSDNGQWLVGDIAGRGMTRVNIETGESMTFGDIYNYNNGISPHFVMGISGNGRYVLAAENTYEILRIYDLTTCTAPIAPSKKSSCQSKDLQNFIGSQISGFKAIHHIQFSTDYTIRFYAKYATQTTPINYGYFTITAAGEKESLLDYLALGDSFASGEGAYNYKPYTDTETPFNKCHLSLSSYPFLLSARPPLNTAQSVACSGARLKDVVDTPLSRFTTNNESQSQGKSDSSFDASIYHDFLVGYRTQTNFVSRNKPGTVTISVGGNDMGFGSIVKACVSPGTCYTDPQQRLDLLHTINSKFDELVSAYTQIKDNASSAARIYALGYPTLVAPRGDCAINVRLDRQELGFANELVGYINQVIRTASLKAGVTYIDLEHALDGHRLCEAPANNIAVNGLTAGDDKTFSVPLGSTDYVVDFNILGRESYHPNALGHRLLADAIIRQTSDFSSAVTISDPSVGQPSINRPDTFLAGVTAQMTPRRIIHESAIVPRSLILRGVATNIHLAGLKPGSNTVARLHAPSYLVTIGAITLNQTNTSNNLVLPGDTPAGIYTIEIEGTTSSGEPILLQQVIYVAASPNDIDGDGVLDDDEHCLTVDPLNTNDPNDGCRPKQDRIVLSPINNEQNTNTSIPASLPVSVSRLTVTDIVTATTVVPPTPPSSPTPKVSVLGAKTTTPPSMKQTEHPSLSSRSNKNLLWFAIPPLLACFGYWWWRRR